MLVLNTNYNMVFIICRIISREIDLFYVYLIN